MPCHRLLMPDNWGDKRLRLRLHASLSGFRALICMDHFAAVRFSEDVMRLFGLAGTALIALMVMIAAATAQTSSSNTDTGAEADVIKVYDENTLTPDAIRKCLRTDQGIVRMEEKLAEYEATLAGFLKQISDLADDLDKRRKQIDGTDPKAVDIYNKRVDRHRNMIERYNTKFLPTLADRKTKLNTAISTYNSDCADKAYFEEDWLAAIAELGVEDPRPQAGGGK